MDESTPVRKRDNPRHGSPVLALTEVHVLQPETRPLPGKKCIWRGFGKTARYLFGTADRSKYYGNWYGNRLALTICVNTKALLFSQSKSSALCEMPSCCPASFHYGDRRSTYVSTAG